MAQLTRRRRRPALSSRQRAELRRELERELQRLGVSSAPQGRTYRIRETLRRMASPEFGLCRGCRETISYERLCVLPETTLCAECSRHRERWMAP